MTEKAKIRRLDSNEEFTVMFNPTSYDLAETGKLSGEGSMLQFERVSIEDFTVTLFFDTYEQKSDVRKIIQPIASLVVPTVEGKKTKQPPVCLFIYGDFTYKGVVYKIVRKFTMFLKTGIPVRAEVTLTFKSVVTTEEDAVLRGSEACLKHWLVKAGDRLDTVAFSALKDARQWRIIADANAIDDPITFPTDKDVGTMLVIPD